MYENTRIGGPITRRLEFWPDDERLNRELNANPKNDIRRGVLLYDALTVL